MSRRLVVIAVILTLAVVVGLFVVREVQWRRSESRWVEERSVLQRSVDEARLREEIFSLGRFLDSAVSACPDDGRCFLSENKRAFVLQMAANTMRSRASIWSSMARRAFQDGALSAERDVAAVIDGLFMQSSETASFWDAAVTDARVHMKGELRANGVKAFLSPPGTMGPHVPAKLVMMKVVTFDDQQLIDFAVEWERRKVEFFEAVIGRESKDTTLAAREPVASSVH